MWCLGPLCTQTPSPWASAGSGGCHWCGCRQHPGVLHQCRPQQHQNPFCCPGPQAGFDHLLDVCVRCGGLCLVFVSSAPRTPNKLLTFYFILLFKKRGTRYVRMVGLILRVLHSQGLGPKWQWCSLSSSSVHPWLVLEFLPLRCWTESLPGISSATRRQPPAFRGFL